MRFHCQKLKDYGGWPEDLSELPLQHMTPAHINLLASKCSRSKDIAMPVFPASHGQDTPKNDNVSRTDITPETTQNFSSSDANTLGGQQPVAKAPSKQALALHRKWQEAAEAMGGPDARIVVSKPIAKKLIFHLLHDAFRPLNITQIHKVKCWRIVEAACICTGSITSKTLFRS